MISQLGPNYNLWHEDDDDDDDKDEKDKEETKKKKGRGQIGKVGINGVRGVYYGNGPRLILFGRRNGADRKFWPDASHVTFKSAPH